MSTKRRWIALALALCLMLCLGACEEPREEPQQTQPSQTEPTQTEPSQPQLEPAMLVGVWTSIRGQGNCLYTQTYQFLEDGTFWLGDYDYIYQPSPEGGWDWFVAGRGYVTTEGTYDLKDGQLVLTYCSNDMEDFEDYTRSIPLLRLDETYLVLEDDYGTYVINTAFQMDDLESLCRLVGIEYAPEEQEGC